MDKTRLLGALFHHNYHVFLTKPSYGISYYSSCSSRCNLVISNCINAVYVSFLEI